MKTLTLICSKQRISSKSVILLILWDALMSVHTNSMQHISGTDVSDNSNNEHHQSQYIVNGIGLCLVYLSFPLLGLLADVKTGRYKTIITSVYFSFLSWIIGGLTIIIKIFLPEYDILSLIVFSIAFILELIGVCCFQSNIVQFSLDQVIGASSDELSSIILWHIMCVPLSYIISKIGQCMIEQFVIVSYVMSGMAVSVVLAKFIL